jgi:hypothetical protein
MKAVLSLLLFKKYCRVLKKVQTVILLCCSYIHRLVYDRLKVLGLTLLGYRPLFMPKIVTKVSHGTCSTFRSLQNMHLHLKTELDNVPRIFRFY